MQFAQFARWAGGILLAAGLAAGGSGSAIAQTVPANPAEPAATLYDQTNHVGSNTADSTDWGNQFRTSNSQAADDFIVPANAIWRITSASVSGTYFGSAPSGNLALLIQFYSNLGSLPSTRLFSQTVPTGSISGLDTGNFAVSLAPALTLGPGHYWFSAQARINCTATNCKHWVWIERSLQFQTASVWQNPLKGVVPFCPTWQPRVDVCHNPSPENSGGKDLLFKLDGASVPIVGNLMLPLVRR